MLFLAMESGLEKLWQRFSSVDLGCQEEFYCQEASGRIETEYSLCGGTNFHSSLLCSGSSCAFALCWNYPQNQWNRQKRSLYAVCLVDFSSHNVLIS